MAQWWPKRDYIKMVKLKTKKDRARDTGLAITLILIIWAIYSKNLQLVFPAAVTLFLAMALPMVFSPFAPLWFGFAEIMGTIMSQVILTILFYGLLLPLGLARRLTGADPLALKRWRSGKESVFVKRDAEFVADDLTKPF
jgi:hypothetical protein